uniref:Uncharacterized protein n=1 Tax=Megaviridae environmental sample TaxID=1737588 RepID=A0A5J6VK48_9VIRU|nr:MAG: hypothetical protein [Megaviridae environmental sample]
MSFEQKYLKYKEKYLNLKNTLKQSGIDVIKNETSEYKYDLDMSANHKTISEMILTETPSKNTIIKPSVVSEQNSFLRDSVVNINENINLKGGGESIISEMILSDTINQDNLNTNLNTNLSSDDDLSEMVLSDTEVVESHGGSISNVQPAPVKYTKVNNTTNCPKSREMIGAGLDNSQPADVNLGSAPSCEFVNSQPDVSPPKDELVGSDDVDNTEIFTVNTDNNSSENDNRANRTLYSDQSIQSETNVNTEYTNRSVSPRADSLRSETQISDSLRSESPLSESFISQKFDSVISENNNLESLVEQSVNSDKSIYTSTELQSDKSEIDMLLNHVGGGKNKYDDSDYEVSDSLSSLFDSSDLEDSWDSSESISDLVDH